jgi:hypothetical protein
MAQETNESVTYLKALKQFTGPQAATAAAPAQEPAPEAHPQPGSAANQLGEQFKGSEKRRSPRYKCEGSADIREEGCEVRTWATFTDISLHGCYVEAQATYPVGTLLHMKLEANGSRVETKGTVRVSYPYLGMGIAFVEMSDENRAHLKEMLGTVSRPAIIMGPGVVSSLPSSSPMEALPIVSDPPAAIQALVTFFESHHMLTREDFLRTLAKSQK